MVVGNTKIVLVTGGFDPLHSGHIAYFKEARNLGDMLIVGINSDEWLARKKGRAFMPWNERLCIINNLSMVDEVYTFDDEDGSAKHFIQQVRAHYPDSKLIFANGGDRTKDNIPEMDINDDNVEFMFGVGGEDKRNSSSWILQEWKNPKVIRPWGYYEILLDTDYTKVKQITVNPGQKLSYQYHEKRKECWTVVKGGATIILDDEKVFRSAGESITIPLGAKHRIINETEDILVFVTQDNVREIYLEEVVQPTLKNMIVTGVYGINRMFFCKDGTDKWMIETENTFKNLIPFCTLC
jgi:D-beta-D-heptose 7-phosphate kinase/D-beta-D-heptose 1-phosphate adenosyltransferase